jgi:16S rRNA (guanine1207-N2)-methyltransferase
MAARLADAKAASSLLVVDDEDGAVEAAAEAAGSRVERWRRRAGPGIEPAPWPGRSEVSAAAVRLPKGRDTLVMTLHAALSRVEPGGSLWLYGANDEGARSAGSALEACCDDVFTADTRRHCRVWKGRRGAAPLRGELDDWCSRSPVELGGCRVEVAWFPGLFARGRLDPATRLLCEVLPSPRRRARVLDFGCGAGLLSMALARQGTDLELHLLDRDALAIEAARRNLPDAGLHLGQGWSAVPPGLRFDLVVSNPPIHRGVARDESVVRELLDGAGERLRAGGALWLVAQSTVPLGRWLEARFASVQLAGEVPGFRSWRAERPRRR